VTAHSLIRRNELLSAESLVSGTPSTLLYRDSNVGQPQHYQIDVVNQLRHCRCVNLLWFAFQVCMSGAVPGFQ
jgi:hypothetical protein